MYDFNYKKKNRIFNQKVLAAESGEIYNFSDLNL